MTPSDQSQSKSEIAEDAFVRIIITYGIGYGFHETDLDVPADATDEEIYDMVLDMLSERLNFGWERES